MKIVAKLVDGGELEITAGGRVTLQRLKELQAKGLTGKGLIDEWITDDWGPPPSLVIVTHRDPSGRMIEQRISYE